MRSFLLLSIRVFHVYHGVTDPLCYGSSECAVQMNRSWCWSLVLLVAALVQLAAGQVSLDEATGPRQIGAALASSESLRQVHQICWRLGFVISCSMSHMMQPHLLCQIHSAMDP